MRYWIVGALAFVLLAGCAMRTDRGASPPQDNRDHQVKVQQTVPPAKRITNPQQTANRLEHLAETVPQVKGANCVVIGNTAIVGIDVPGNLDRAKVGTIKYSVAEALRKDPDGANAVVTADLDITSRLREIRQEVRNGRPLSGFAEELADIVGRIMPQLPRSVMPLNNPPVDTEHRKSLKNKSL